MIGKTNILFGALTLLLAFPDVSSAQEAQSYSYAYIRFLVGSAEVQRATEAEPTEAGINLPIQSGDRVWTRADARVELEYGDGSVLRMDSQTRVDFTSFGERGGETFIRLWSGSVILRLDEEKAKSFRLDTPAGTIYPASAGTFRVDVNNGGESTVLSVYEGVAELASEEGSVLARSGQRSIVEPGRRPEPSFAFNTAHFDDFLAWNDERDSQYAHTERIEGVPPEVGGYVGALSRHGTWRVDVQLGPVWYPSVSVGWYPYDHGRWVYSSYGWTWASHEPWGWAPYHYGRWGHNHVGWYWIPGAHWGPAWVSWAIGPSWIGWCPLGYSNRPVHHYNEIWGRGGKAVRRGGRAVPRTRGHSWNFVRTADLGHRSSSKARLRTADIQTTSRQAQLLESGAALNRGLRPRAAGAAATARLPRSGTSGTSGVARTSDRSQQRSVTTRPTGQIDRSTRSTNRLQEGRARPRTAPGELPSRSSSPSSSTLRQGTSRALSSGGTAPKREGAIQRNATRPRAPAAPGARSTERGIFGESASRERSQPSSRGRTSVQRRTSPQQAPRNQGTTRSSEPRGLSSTRGRTRPQATPQSKSQSDAAKPNRQSGSERGRSFFSRITKSRPSTAPSQTSSRSRPSAQPSRPSGSRPPKASSPPSQSGGSKSRGSARSTRGKAKPRKKN